MNNKLVYIVAGACLVLGSGASIAIQAFAQQNTTATPTVQTQNQATTTPVVSKDASDTNEPAETSEPADSNTHGHRSLGGDGVISSINGTTIVMAEEGNEGSASYTVDASSATVTNNGVVAKLSDLKVGDKVFVDGAVSGMTVKATSISLGHPGENKANDANEGPETKGAPETNDAGSSSAE
jgi:hypothetical protein